MASPPRAPVITRAPCSAACEADAKLGADEPAAQPPDSRLCAGHARALGAHSLDHLGLDRSQLRTRWSTWARFPDRSKPPGRCLYQQSSEMLRRDAAEGRIAARHLTPSQAQSFWDDGARRSSGACGGRRQPARLLRSRQGRGAAVLAPDGRQDGRSDRSRSAHAPRSGFGSAARIQPHAAGGGGGAVAGGAGRAGVPGRAHQPAGAAADAKGWAAWPPAISRARVPAGGVGRNRGGARTPSITWPASFSRRASG